MPNLDQEDAETIACYYCGNLCSRIIDVTMAIPVIVDWWDKEGP